MSKTRTDINTAKTIGKYTALSALIALGAACGVVSEKQSRELYDKEATYLSVIENPQADLRGRSHIALFDTDGDKTTAEIYGYVAERNIAKLEQNRQTPMRMAEWQRKGVEKARIIHQKTR